MYFVYLFQGQIHRVFGVFAGLCVRITHLGMQHLPLSLSKRVNLNESSADAPFHRMRSAAPGWRRWSWRRPAKPGPGVKAPSMGAFHRPSGFHGRPRRRRPPSGSPSKCSALALHLHGKPPARCRRRPGRTASVWQCAACAERGTSTRPCRLASAGAALRPPPCSDHRAGSYCQETRVSVWSSSKYRRTLYCNT